MRKNKDFVRTYVVFTWHIGINFYRKYGSCSPQSVYGGHRTPFSLHPFQLSLQPWRRLLGDITDGEMKLSLWNRKEGQNKRMGMKNGTQIKLIKNQPTKSIFKLLQHITFQIRRDAVSRQCITLWSGSLRSLLHHQVPTKIRHIPDWFNPSLNQSCNCSCPAMVFWVWRDGKMRKKKTWEDLRTDMMFIREERKEREGLKQNDSFKGGNKAQRRKGRK